MRSLLDYAYDPRSSASPLPPQSARRTRREHGFESLRGWPVDLLPAPALAVDLARRGVAFRRGTGYTVDGAYAEPDQVARLAADVVSDAAACLGGDSAALWRAHAADLEEAAESAYLASIDAHSGPDGLLADAVDSATVIAGGALLASVVRLLDEADVDSIDTRVRREKWALRYTADDLRTSIAARARLLGAIRPHLPEPSGEAEQNPALALAFLASFDDRPAVRRSELAALYAEAGSPGDLTPADLRELATARWSRPVKLRGHYTYRPAFGPIVEPQLAPQTVPDFGESRAVTLAREYAEAKLALDGVATPAERLGELFGLTPYDAHAVADSLGA
jgi:hypothetical protein